MLVLMKLLSLLVTNIIYKKNIEHTLQSEMSLHKNENLGYDERYVNYYTNITSNKSSKLKKKETEEILNISRYIDILEKINKLQNVIKLGPYIHDEHVQTILKNEIGYNEIKPYSINAGGLFSDW